ncbi:hypothetical protein [Rubrivirga litoralis]|uniref:Flagellar protein FliT n=2 Tax=Rubrivirga TaxID=1434037 RepID=A0ABU3BST1_9BACT|nr:hypothetical protein [Rubrivirga sp. F394]MDT0632352.1 hypothetical protein [Rubrivirga sp. F394]
MTTTPPAEAAFQAGARLLAALDADDLDAVLVAARERGGAVDRLARSGAAPDAALAARFAEQDRALADRLGRAHDQIAEALRQSGRTQRAAGRYASAAPPAARLRARG